MRDYRLHQQPVTIVLPDRRVEHVQRLRGLSQRADARHVQPVRRPQLKAIGIGDRKIARCFAERPRIPPAGAAGGALQPFRFHNLWILAFEKLPNLISNS